MIDDVTDIAKFYNSDPEEEHSRLERHQLEHDLTWRYLNQYLPSQLMTRATTNFRANNANYGLICSMR